jgi:predicted Zn-dependent peptidase
MAVAQAAGQFVWLTGDVAALNQLWSEIEKVTPQDVQRVARQVFQEKGMTVLTLSHPAKEAAKQQGGSR